MMIKFLLIAFCCMFLFGCDLIESSLTDIGNWNLSACYDGFGTCWSLFWDNSHQIVGGSNILDDILSPYANQSVN